MQVYHLELAMSWEANTYKQFNLLGDNPVNGTVLLMTLLMK